MDNEQRFISFIHNYCDRWCERCEFTSHCSAFAAEEEMSDEEKDISSEVFVRNPKNIFADVKEMLAAKANELGIEIESLSDEESDEVQARKRRSLKGLRSPGWRTNTRGTRGPAQIERDNRCRW